MGYDKGFMNIAQYTQFDELNDKSNLKGDAFYMNLRWTLGKKSK